MRALVVDDHRLTRKFLKAILLEMDWIDQVEEAEDGQVALELIQQSPFDLVITDLAMPRMGGLALLEEIQKLETKPVSLVLSSFSEIVYRSWAIELGAADYLVKGISPEGITSAARKALGLA